MKVALIVPEYTANIIRNVAEENLDNMELDVMVYKNYLKAVEIVEKVQKRYDAIMFAGIVVYSFVKSHVKEECIWGYFPLHESSLSFAILKALYIKENIKNISIDTYSMESIKEVYDFIGIDFDEVNVMLYDVKADSYNITEDALKFHKNNLKNKDNICIITALSDVNKQLNIEKISCYMAIPTKSIIIDSFQNLYLRYTAKVNTNSRVVAIFIQIDFPDDYSIISKNEYYYVKEKNKVTELIYEFANKIEAAVIEFSYNTYILISTKKILETETENYTNIDLLRSIEENSLNRISMGIGYGKTASEAKYKANEAMIKSKQCQNENVAYIIYEDGKAVGPVKSKFKKKSNVKIDD
ncbi:MAG: hypothetical protein Q606_CBAC00168G0006, partial [Intestinibacter bartlettii DORA_8_9]